MSKIFKRPMFRKGGPTNKMTGIMSGIQDRENFQDAGRVGELTKQNLDLLMQSDEGNRSFDPLTTFLLQYGPALATARPTGSTIGTLVGAAAKPLESMIAEKRAQEKYMRDIKAGATKLAIEQAGKEDILAQEIAGRKDIEGIKAAGKPDKMSPEYATQFEMNLKNFPGMVSVARRATDFEVENYDALASKVGSARVGGVLNFNINDPEQVKANQKIIKQLAGKFVYDPYENKYKKIIVENGKIGIPQEFNTIEEIKLQGVDGTGTETTITEEKVPSGLFGQKTKPDVITPKIKSFAEDIEKLEGEFGSGA